LGFEKRKQKILNEPIQKKNLDGKRLFFDEDEFLVD